MKNIRLPLLLIVTFLYYGCKNEKPIDDLKLVNHEIERSKVYIELDIIIPKDDIFQIFYTEDGTDRYFGENVVSMEVKGDKKAQKLIFELPEDKKINYFRVDIGSNIEQGPIKLNHVVYKYFNKSIRLNGNLFFEYYTINDFFKLDPQTNNLLPLANKEGYDPILYIKDASISDVYNKLLK